MAQQKINLRPKGLYTNVNQLGTVPPGALVETENCVISRPNIIGVRRGRKTSAFFADRITDDNGATYRWVPGETPIRLFNASLRVGGTLNENFLGKSVPGVIMMSLSGKMFWSEDGNVFTQVQPVYGLDPLMMGAPPALGASAGGKHYYGFEQGGAFFVATASGVIAVGRPLSNSPYVAPAAHGTTEQIQDWARAGYAPAGAPWGISTKAKLGPTGTAVSVDSQVAYRFCFGYRDANNRVRRGAPSGRAVVINPTGNDKNAVVSTVIPPGIIKTRHFWQLYRSQPSSSEATDPGDDTGLIAEGEFPDTSIEINNVARTGTVVTATTAAPHSLVQTEIFALKNDITLPPVDAPEEFFIDQTTATTRIIKKQTGNTATFVTVSTFSLPVEAGGRDIGKVLLFVRDTVSNVFYYIEEGHPGITFIDANGNFVKTIPIGDNFTADQAAWDQRTRKIYCLCRHGETPEFRYDINPSWAIEFDPVVELVTSQNACPAFAPLYASTLQLTAHNFSTLGAFGIWRANTASTAYWIYLNPCTGVGSSSHAFTSANKGASWTKALTLQSPVGPDYANEIYFTCFDYAENPATGETVGLIGISQVYAYSTGRTVRRATVYGIVNGGYGTPIWKTTTVDYQNDLSGGKTRPIIQAVRIHRTDGTVIAAVSMMGTFATNTYECNIISFPFKYSVSGTHFLLYMGGAPAWIAGYDIRTAALCDSIGSAPPTMLLMAKLDIGTGAADYNVYEVHGSGAAAAYTYIQGLNLPSSGSLDLMKMPGATRGIGSSGTPIIKAGTYTVVSVADATHFTFNSVQTPQSNFPATSVSAFAEHLELTVTDTIPPEFIGPLLYSSPAVEGSLQMNFPPPFCKDAALFRTTAFYANAIQRTTVQITMLQLPLAGERLYLGNSNAYYITAAVAENVGAFEFKIGTTGTLSQKIKETIDSIARVANCNWRTFRNVIFPVGVGDTAFSTFFISGVLPRDAVSLKNTAANGTTVLIGKFTPNDIYGESVQEKNALYYSKSEIPDAVPLTNYIRIGSDSKEILRVIASRDATFVFKEDGCFIVRGYGPPWQVDPFDLTLELSVKDSLVQLDNNIFGAFKRGIFKISDANAELLSLPVQDQVEQMLAGDLNDFANANGFGCADNSDHKYLLWLPESQTVEDYPSRVMVYDTFTNEWTTWNYPARHCVTFRGQSLAFAFQQASLNSGGTAISGRASGIYPCVMKENHALNDNDFFDDVSWMIPDTTNADASAKWIEHYDPVAQIISISESSVGPYDVIVPFGELPSYPDAIMPDIVEEVGPNTTFKIFNGFVSWIPAGFPQDTKVTIYRGIRHGWKFVQAFPESPAATNHFSEMAVSFRKAYWSKLQANFELPAEQQDPAHAAQVVDFNGIHHFGPLRQPSKNNFIRTYVPRQSQRGTTLIAGIATGACGMAIESNGITLILTQGPTSFQRR